MIIMENIMAKKKEESKHYIDNKQFLAALVEYKKEVNRAKKNNDERPQVPDYIGDLKKEVKQQYVNYISQAKETRKKILDQEERSDAADELLREVNNGDVRIIEIDEDYGEYYGEEEGRE